MKNILLVLVVFLIGFSFSSCDEDDIVDLLPSFKVSVNEIENITIHIDQTIGDRVAFSEKTDLNIINGDTEDYLDKIEAISISKLSYKIINFSGDPVGDVAGSFAVAGQVSLSNDFVVKTSADNQIVYEITDVNELNRIANTLLSGQSVVVKYSGNALCDADDMDFIVEVTLVAKVTIDP